MKRHAAWYNSRRERTNTTHAIGAPDPEHFHGRARVLGHERGHARIRVVFHLERARDEGSGTTLHDVHHNRTNRHANHGRGINDVAQLVGVRTHDDDDRTDDRTDNRHLAELIDLRSFDVGTYRTPSPGHRCEHLQRDD